MYTSWLKGLAGSSILIASLMTMLPAYGRVTIPGFELVYNAPIETTLRNDDILTTTSAWQQLIQGAKHQIDINETYVSDQPPSQLTSIINELEKAGKRGIHIHLLVENGVDFSTPATLRKLAHIPNLELRKIAYRDVAGGIIHAKYMIADGRLAYVGSANFDWRSLRHIQETGLLITDPTVLKEMQQIFNVDWNQEARLAKGEKAQPVNAKTVAVPEHGNYLIASPRAFNPAGVVDSEDALKHLFASAKDRVRVQVMTYSPLGFARKKGEPQPYYPVIDESIRAAAARGVHIELMVANWSVGKNRLPWLRSLAMVPHVKIKVVTIPQASSGEIPYARVIHSKFMTIDGHIAWVGTSNWDGGYLDDSRNLEVVMHSTKMTSRLNGLFDQLWNSQYAAPLQMK